MFFQSPKKIFLHITSQKISLAVLQDQKRKPAIKKLAEFKANDQLFFDYLQKEQLQHAETIVFLDSQKLFAQIVSIPIVHEAEIKRVIFWELYKYLHQDWEMDLVFDYSALSLQAINKNFRNYLVIGIKKADLSVILQPLEKAKLNIRKIDTEASLFSDLYQHLTIDKRQEDCLLFWDQKRFVLNFFFNNELVFTCSEEYFDLLESLEQGFNKVLKYLQKYFFDLKIQRLIIISSSVNSKLLAMIVQRLQMEVSYLEICSTYFYLPENNLLKDNFMPFLMSIREVGLLESIGKNIVFSKD